MRVETSSIRDLPGLHRMGHTCANLNGDLFFIWGGSDVSTAYLTARNTHLWIYETLTGYWRHRTCSGECPPYLSGTTSALIGQKMYVFGGHSTVQDNWLNSLYCLDLETFTWRDVGASSKAEPTKPIRSDKCVSWSHNGRYYVFGGYGWSQVEHLLQLLDKQKDLQLVPDYRWPKFGWNNQLVEFNPLENTWRWPSYTGKCPSARAALSGAIMGDVYYLFGGRDSRERLNDLYALNMNTFEWFQVATFSDLNQTQLERPIRHLLEGTEEEELVDQQVEQRWPLVEDQAVEDDDLHVPDEENLTPSPSSTARFQENQIEATDEFDEDDDDRSSFEYHHPSHLLERWSLSSHQSASSSSTLDIHSADCQLPQQILLNHQPNSSCVQENQQLEVNEDLILDNNNQLNQPPNVEQLNDNQSDSQRRESNISVKETPIPTGRSFASFTPISDYEIVLFGGISSQDENLHDCWLFNTKNNTWMQLDLKTKHPRLWHTCARTKNNEVVIIGGSSSEKVDDFCTDILSISLEPKTLKRLALDSIAKSIRMRSINKVKGLPATVCKLIRLRKQAIALTTIRRYNNNQVAVNL